MADVFELAAEIRTELGKSESRRLRRLAEKVPAIIYGAGKECQPVTISHRQISVALKNEAFSSHILTLNVNGAQEKVVLKALQRHPYKPKILHADFMRVSATEKLTMNVPIHFLNEETAPGVKVDGGIISRLVTDLEIRCFPGDLPEYIAVDLATLQLGESIHLSQISLPKGVELVALLQHNDDRSIVSIHMPQVIEEPEVVVAPSAEVPVVGEENEEGNESSDNKE
jgi:large subunit ribosomal protein L25